MPTSRQEDIQKIHDMIDDIQFAMLVTVNEQDDIHSRPMTTQEMDKDGSLWFFAARTADSVRDIQNHSRINVTYMGDGTYVSIAGHAHIHDDLAKKKELWQDALKIWFEDGPEDPNVVLIHVQSTSAHYWTSPSGILGKAVAAAKVILTGEPQDAGESDVVSL